MLDGLHFIKMSVKQIIGDGSCKLPRADLEEMDDGGANAECTLPVLFTA
jgi:hypothetical protein